MCAHVQRNILINIPYLYSVGYICLSLGTMHRLNEAVFIGT